MAVAFVLVSLQAMNQGLLSRFMGYLGMFAGALVLFQITQVPGGADLLAAGHRLPHLGPLAHRRAAGVALGPRRAVAVLGGDARPARRRHGRPTPARRPQEAAAPPPSSEPEAAAAAPVNERTRAATPKRKRKRRTSRRARATA